MARSHDGSISGSLSDGDRTPKALHRAFQNITQPPRSGPGNRWGLSFSPDFAYGDSPKISPSFAYHFTPGFAYTISPTAYRGASQLDVFEYARDNSPAIYGTFVTSDFHVLCIVCLR